MLRAKLMRKRFVYYDLKRLDQKRLVGIRIQRIYNRVLPIQSVRYPTLTPGNKVIRQTILSEI
jgi:hypothetical protein